MEDHTVLGVVGISGVVALESVAMLTGHDGALFPYALGAVVAIAGGTGIVASLKGMGALGGDK